MKMEHLTRTLCAAMAAAAMTAAVSCSRTAEADYDIVPAPLEVTAAEGEPFLMKNCTDIFFHAGDEAMRRNAGFIAEFIGEQTGL